MDREFKEFLKVQVKEKNLGVLKLQEIYPDEDHWELRRIVAEVKREQALIRTDETAIETKISKKGVEALQAGWLRPINLSFDTLPPSEPSIEKNGRVIGVISDPHYPDHDEHAIDVMFQIGRFVGFDELIINGDLFHCSSLAKYVPSAEQHLRWVDEKKASLAEIIKIRQNFPDIPIKFLPGNHDTRPIKWINANAVPLQGLFSLSEWLGLDDVKLNFELVEEGKIMLANGNLMVKHGTRVSQSAGSSVMREMDRAGCSVIIGHVHRRAIVEETKASGEITGVELGCLCQLSPDYLEVEDTANWQHGFAIVTEYGDDFGVELVRINKGKADFRGHRFVSRITD